MRRLPVFQPDRPRSQRSTSGRTKTGSKTAGFHFVQSLHAIDVMSRAERPGSPVDIRASVKGSDPAKDVEFDPSLENPRSALLLVGGNIYLMWG